MARIPNVLHYVFGMAADFGGKPWSLVHHVCVASAIHHIKPEAVYLYYEFEPTGPWWALTKPMVTPVQIKSPDNVFGQPLCHVAHKADVVRLQTLIEKGGIYLDADVLVQKSFAPLLNESTVLGREGDDEGEQYGMANAVILAEPHAPFLERWFAEYHWFRSKGRDEYWSEHSVQLPSKLAKEHPDEITVLGPRAFFWPLWTPDHIDWIFKSDKPIALDSEVYANHLWEAKAWEYLHGLTPGALRKARTNFSAWASPYLEGLPDDYGKLPPQETMRSALRRVKRFLLPGR